MEMSAPVSVAARPVDKHVYYFSGIISYNCTQLVPIRSLYERKMPKLLPSGGGVWCIFQRARKPPGRISVNIDHELLANRHYDYGRIRLWG